MGEIEDLLAVEAINRQLGAGEERAACAELVRAAGCICFILEAADAGFKGEIGLYQANETGCSESLHEVVEHDPRCPIVLAAAIEAQGRA